MAVSLIPIEITGAKIKSIHISYGESDQMPEFCAEVTLLLPTGQSLTSMYVRSDYPINNAPEKTVEFGYLAALLKKEIHILITQHLNNFQGKLGKYN